jgi:hypothetical protein
MTETHEAARRSYGVHRSRRPVTTHLASVPVARVAVARTVGQDGGMR